MPCHPATNKREPRSRPFLLPQTQRLSRTLGPPSSPCFINEPAHTCIRHPRLDTTLPHRTQATGARRIKQSQGARAAVKCRRVSLLHRGRLISSQGSHLPAGSADSSTSRTSPSLKKNITSHALLLQPCWAVVSSPPQERARVYVNACPAPLPAPAV